jgi:hypothetical protein
MQEELSKFTCMSHDTISKVEKILKTASSEEIEKARIGDVSVHQI